jgi:hypothetical protein
MRTKIPLLAGISASMLLAACATTSFQEYQGPDIIHGKGGTVRKADGIDFWDNGEPYRKYKILGVINDSRDYGKIASAFRDESIAKITRERGGDAVIVLSNSLEYSGVDYWTRGSDFNRTMKFIVVKYLP